MSRKVRTQQKHILLLDARVATPESKVDSPDVIFGVVRNLRAEKLVAVGINAVSRAMAQRKVQFVVFASDVNPPDIVQHVLVMAGNGNIPVIITKVTAKDMGRAIGLRSAAVVGLLKGCRQEISEALAPFCSDVDLAGLPFVRLQTDMYVPKRKEKPAKA